MSNDAPLFDLDGLHVLDPNDRLGIKTRYITLLHEHALTKYLPRPTAQGQVALDVGCGYGRLTRFLDEMGWRATGIDPSHELIAWARSRFPGVEFRVGAMPDLPVPGEAAQVLLLQNVLRSLHLSSKMAVLVGIGRFVAPGGWIALTENIREGHPDYVAESEVVRIFEREGLSLEKRIPLRAGHWWILYLIRYGLIPERLLPAIADHELALRRQSSGRSRRTYYNVFFLFRKPSRKCGHP